ncbi:PGG domain [Sesbania bispinosa]|nr:PGG domain [Sesbania bispinosa]
MEILTDPNSHDDTMRGLYDASLNGCVNTLKTLIQKDPLILSRVSLYPFTETPLHIALLLGHLEFCEILLHTNPTLASEVNSEGRCPLHLASAKGHTEIVKTLLQINPEMCLIRDKDDKLPLHFAAMRGHMGAIKELIRARPDCIREMTETDNGSILHLCVRYNHLEALKLLVESVRGDYQFLSSKDKEDNTILHLAVKRKQIKIIKYLLSVSEMSRAINSLNRAGLTPLDMLERCEGDFISLTIEHILSEKGAQRSTNTNTVIAQQLVSSATQFSIDQMALSQSIEQETPSPINDSLQPSHPSQINDPLQQSQPVPSNDPQQPSQHSPSNGPSQPQHPSPSNGPEQTEHECSRWDRFENFCTTYLISQGNWIDNKKTKEQWMVAATVIATMTFQSVLSPPGGVWQEDTLEGTHACTDYGICEAGTAVVGHNVDIGNFNDSSSHIHATHIHVGIGVATRVIFWIRSRRRSSTNAHNSPGRMNA